MRAGRHRAKVEGGGGEWRGVGTLEEEAGKGLDYGFGVR